MTYIYQDLTFDILQLDISSLKLDILRLKQAGKSSSSQEKKVKFIKLDILNQRIYKNQLQIDRGRVCPEREKNCHRYARVLTQLLLQFIDLRKTKVESISIFIYPKEVSCLKVCSSSSHVSIKNIDPNLNVDQ